MAFLYALDDAAEVQSELRSNPDSYRLVLEVILRKEELLGNVGAGSDP